MGEKTDYKLDLRYCNQRSDQKYGRQGTKPLHLHRILLNFSLLAMPDRKADFKGGWY